MVEVEWIELGLRPWSDDCEVSLLLRLKRELYLLILDEEEVLPSRRAWPFLVRLSGETDRGFSSCLGTSSVGRLRDSDFVFSFSPSCSGGVEELAADERDEGNEARNSGGTEGGTSAEEVSTSASTASVMLNILCFPCLDGGPIEVVGRGKTGRGGPVAAVAGSSLWLPCPAALGSFTASMGSTTALGLRAWPPCRRKENQSPKNIKKEIFIR